MVAHAQPNGPAQLSRKLTGARAKTVGCAYQVQPRVIAVSMLEPLSSRANDAI